jgi:hypothetical protein
VNPTRLQTALGSKPSNNGVDDRRDVSVTHRNTMNDPHEKPPPAGPAIDVDALKRAIAAVVATVIVAVCETLWRRR